MSSRLFLVFVTALATFLGVLTTSSNAAGRAPLIIDMKAKGFESSSGQFLLNWGKVLDGGKVEGRFLSSKDSTTPEGLSETAFKQRVVFTGRQGTITIMATGHWFELGYGFYDWSGRWRIVTGTDLYAGLHARGVWRGTIMQAAHTLVARYAARPTT